MEVVWKFLVPHYIWEDSFNIRPKYGVFTSFLEDVPSSNLGPGTIIKHLYGAFLMPKHHIGTLFKVF